MVNVNGYISVMVNVKLDAIVNDITVNATVNNTTGYCYVPVTLKKQISMCHSVLHFFANVKYKCECGYVNVNGYVSVMVNVKLDTIVNDITVPEIPDSVFCLVDCPHDWLFPQCLAVLIGCGCENPMFNVLLEKLESIPLMVQGVWSEDPAAQIEATTQFRKLLSIERSPPIDEVIKAGVVPRFVEFLGRHDLPQLQFEAAWALTNVASGTSEHTRVVIEHGAVPKFVQLLSSASDDVHDRGWIDSSRIEVGSEFSKEMRSLHPHQAFVPPLRHDDKCGLSVDMEDPTWNSERHEMERCLIGYVPNVHFVSYVM
ncbi:Importin subunit alpha-4 [Camellia lanceoleosa]|uniref:Importin subunit alpha-4 n=1 Tax=Camellia lanceoleosa TaxID=1840588 RepID=A0ACC0F3V6_9ERIC|nr:Importin subunit alpha-4 [Camellia lanceoleosa]